MRCHVLIVTALAFGLHHVDALHAQLSAPTDDMTAKFKVALKAAASPEAKSAIRNAYLRGMARANKAIEAYRAFPGGRESFRILAEQLVASGHDASLVDLLSEHETFFDDDPYLGVYGGHLAFEAKNYAEADIAWTTAFKVVDDQFLVDQFHRRRVLARNAIGKMVEALDEIAPLNKTFAILADECLRDRKREQLEKLLEAYERKERYSQYSVLEYRFRMNEDAAVAVLEKIAASPADIGFQRDSNLRSLYSFLARNGRALEAYKAAPDKKFAFDSLSHAMLYEKQLGDLPALIESHRKVQADDPNLRQAEGEMYLLTHQFEKAIACLKPESEKPAKRSLLRSLGEYKYVEACYLVGKGLQAYEELGFDEVAFDRLARLYFAAGDPAGLEALLKARPAGKNAVRDGRVWEQQAQLHILKGNAEEALKLFVANRATNSSPFGGASSPFQPGKVKKGKTGTPGIFGQRDPEMENIALINCETKFMRDMASAGEGMAVYLVAKLPENAFHQLAAHYQRTNDGKSLAKLVEEHRAKHPRDPELPLYTGHVELMRGNAAAAEAIFRAELAKRDPEKPDRVIGGVRFPAIPKSNLPLTDGLMRASIRQGRTLEYYRFAGSDSATFRMLAEFCVDEKAPAELATLLAAHRKSHADEAAATRRFEADLLFLKGDYEGALPLYKAVVGKQGFFRRFASDSANDFDERDKMLICLVRLQRSAEAVRMAAEGLVTAPGFNPITPVLAYAASGDVKQTQRLLLIYTRQGHRPESFYRHADLGPLLRGELMQPVREQFPDPAKAKRGA